VILTALPTEDSVRGVYAQMSDVAAAGQLYVDHSTVSINLNRWCADTLAAKHAAFLDAPVSGGPAGAEAGTLTVMVGGDEETFNRALPVFEQFGGTIRLCGPVGGGQAVKLVNQLLVAVHTMAASEAARTGRAARRRPRDGARCHRNIVRQLGDAAAQSSAVHRT